MRETVRSRRLFSDYPGEDEDEDRRRFQADGFPSRTAETRRRAPRRRVLLSAIIVDLDVDGFVRCRLENVSDGGACLKLSERRFLPSTFWLVATTSGYAYKAKIAWRCDYRLGVTLGEPGDLSDPVNLTERRLRRIWRMAC